MSKNHLYEVKHIDVTEFRQFIKCNQVFTAFALNDTQLRLIKWMGVVLIKQESRTSTKDYGNVSVILATEGLPGCSNKTEHFSYKWK